MDGWGIRLGDVFVNSMSGCGRVHRGVLGWMLETAIAVPLILFPTMAIATSELYLAQSGAEIPIQDGRTPETTPSLPESVKMAVLQAAATQTGIPFDQLAVTKALPKIWSDGCLGLADPGQLCTAVLVKGWQVTVSQNRREWVYRTNTSGNAIRYDPAGGRLAQLVKPVAETIPEDQLPPPLKRAVLFRQIRGGGIAGTTQAIKLYRDGRLVQVQDNRQEKSSEKLIRRLPKGEVKAFKKLLEQRAFGQFDRLRYPAVPGMTDYFTVTLSTPQSTTQYVEDNRTELPQDLQVVIVGWQTILSGR